MSGKLPSKGYSVPRAEVGQSSSSRFCQNCSSTEHWTYQCQQSDKNTAKKPANRLSPSQMLRLGIKRKRVEVVPEQTAKEKFVAELKAVEREIAQQIQEEKQQQQQQSQKQETGSSAEQERKIKRKDGVDTAAARDSAMIKQESADPTEYSPDTAMPRSTRRRH